MKKRKRKIRLQHSLRFDELPTPEEIEGVMGKFERGEINPQPIPKDPDAYEKAWGVKPKSERA